MSGQIVASAAWIAGYIQGLLKQSWHESFKQLTTLEDNRIERSEIRLDTILGQRFRITVEHLEGERGQP